MKPPFLLLLLCSLSLILHATQPTAVNEWELRKRTSSGMVPYGVTAENGKAIGFTAGVPAMLTIGGGAFSGLTDVTLTSLASGDMLKWSGSAWINRTAANVRTDLGLGAAALLDASRGGNGATDDGKVVRFGDAVTGAEDGNLAATTTMAVYDATDTDRSIRLSHPSGGQAEFLATGIDALAHVVFPALQAGDSLTYNLPRYSATVSGTIPVPTSVGTTTTVLHGSASGQPVFGAVDLTADVTGSLPASRMPALTGDITTSAGAVATTLATVNSNVGSFTNASVTVNAKGLVTAASSGTAAVTSITGTANEITVTGTTTPTLSLPSALTFTGKTVTGGTYASGAFNGTVGVTTPTTGAFTTLSATGAATLSVAGATSTAAQTFTGALLTGGTGTTNFPHIFIQPSGTTAMTTWGTSGTGLGMNLASSSVNFIDCTYAGNTSRFKVAGNGAVTLGTGAGITTTTDTAIGAGSGADIYYSTTSGPFFRSATDGHMSIDNDNTSSSNFFVWKHDTAAYAHSATNELMRLTEAGVLSVRAGNSPGEIQILGDGTKNLSLSHNGTNGVISVSSGAVTMGTTIGLKAYTVATLPSTAATGMVTGAQAYVTDALAPTFLTTLTGGGAIVTPVFYNGTAWVAY